jgi:ABC-type dipeptide/oligopeptide/nickel transport system permease component
MGQVLAQLPVLVALLAVTALLVYAGVRIGPRFLLKRIAGLIFVLLGVTFITFLLGYFSPGTPVQNLCGTKCTAQDIAVLNHVYGLDLPWYEQYARFLNNLVHLNLGLSYAVRGRTVWDILGQGVPISAEIGLLSLAITLLIGVPLGMLAAVRAGSRYDTFAMGLSLICFSVPTFVTIPFFQLLVVLLALHNLPHLPISGWGQPVQILAPVGILTLVGTGFFARLTRTTMLDVLNQDYIRTARAKGLRDRVVLIRHALRNALVPLVTAIGPAVAFVVGGAFFTETLFNIPGIGFMAVASISNKDMPVVQGTVIIVAVSVAVMNLVVDIAYGLLDPRIKVA